MHDLAIGSARRIGPAQHLAHQGMGNTGRIGDPAARLFLAMDMLADRLDHHVQPVNRHAGNRREDRRQASAVRQQMFQPDMFARQAGEFGNDLHHLGREGQLPPLHGAQDQDIGEGLGQGEQAEHRIRAYLPVILAAVIAEGFEQAGFAMPAHSDGRAGIEPRRDILFDHFAQVLQAICAKA